MSKVHIVSLYNRDHGSKLTNWVCDQIVKTTGSDIIHTQMQIEDTLYEYTFPDGAKKTENYTYVKDLSERQPFIVEPTERQIGAMIAWWENEIELDNGYGLLKLFSFLLIAKSKPLWEKIGYTPMTINRIWGEFCSAAADICCKFAGLDLLPDQMEELSNPVEITESKLLGDFE